MKNLLKENGKNKISAVKSLTIVIAFALIIAVLFNWKKSNKIAKQDVSESITTVVSKALSYGEEVNGEVQTGNIVVY